MDFIQGFIRSFRWGTKITALILESSMKECERYSFIWDFK